MRSTVEDVKMIIDTSLEDPVIEAYMTAAYNFMTDVFVGTTLSETILTEIERWLTAHFIASVRERISKEEGAGGAYIRYAGEYGSNLSGTAYGQTAIMMDTSGALAAASGTKSKTVFYAIPQK